MTKESPKKTPTQPSLTGDFIEDFIASSQNFGIPSAYLEWGAIWLVATALGRNVYSINSRGRTYPNLFTLFIGVPGTGKSEAEDLISPFLSELKIRTTAQHVSKAALIDELNDAHIKKVFDKQTFLDYHHAVILSSEFIETFPSYDNHLLGMLSRWWDCLDIVRERKRHLGEVIEINDVCCNLLAGVQPTILAQSFPAAAWSGGFLSRTIFVYVAEKVDFYLRSRGDEQKVYSRKLSPQRFKKLCGMLEDISNLNGEMPEDSTFVDEYLSWRDDDQEPKPAHPRLMYYNIRREHQLEKLAMISAASRGKLLREGQDYIRARSWLESVETNIQDIFVDMHAGEEGDIMADLHAFVTFQGKGTNNPIEETLVRRFLTGKIPTNRQDSFLGVAEKAGFITIHAQANGSHYISAQVQEGF